MEIIYYPDKENFQTAADNDDPLLVLVSFDGNQIIASQIDEAVEHHILLKKAGFKDTDIDKYFRLVVDKDGADWTFVCPESYSTITRKDKKIEEFFKDGMKIIPAALKKIGYDVPIEIAKRYRRHFDVMNNVKLDFKLADIFSPYKEMKRQRPIFRIFYILLFVVAFCILCKPIYYRLYAGDRIKGNVSVTVDGEAIMLAEEDISGCRKVKINSDSTYIAIKGGEFGGYSFAVNIPNIDKEITIVCSQYNWWTVTRFDLDVIIDTANNTVKFEGSYSYVDGDGKIRKGKINELKMLSDDNIKIIVGFYL